MKRIIILLGLLLLPLLALQAQDDGEMQPITLHFAATVGDDMAMCGQTYAGVGADEAEISFTDFRFYVSNIQLLTPEGEAVAFELEQDGMWQTENVALLDFENAEAGCSDTGTAALNGEIIGMAPAGDYVGLKFDMGVPFELNHDDVTTAPSPLNVAAMFWNWQFGYKFIRVDLVTDAEENSGWFIHLGSTGCESVAGAIAPQEPCSNPNITTITFDEFDFENGVIVADLGGLLTDVALYDNTLMPPGCMSGTDDPDCTILFPNFGLSLAEGICPDGDCSAQTLFRISDVDSVTLVERSEMSMDAMSGGMHNMDHSAEATEEAGNGG